MADMQDPIGSLFKCTRRTARREDDEDALIAKKLANSLDWAYQVAIG